MKILVGIDGGAQQRSALTLATQLAGGGELVVVTAYPVTRTTASLGGAYRAVAEESAREILASASEDLRSAVLQTHAVPDLHPARALHDAAVEVDADAIVIGAAHHGPVGRALLGTTGASVVHGSPRPVVVAPRDFAGDAAHPHRIAVAYDGGEEADAALSWAERLARDTGASLELLTVAQFVPTAMYPGFGAYPSDTTMQELRDDAQGRLDAARTRLAVPATGRVLEGPVVPGIIEAAADADLLVAGSRGYGPVRSLMLGSTSQGLMHHASCPVVVVPRSAAVAGREPDATEVGEPTAPR